MKRNVIWMQLRTAAQYKILPILYTYTLAKLSHAFVYAYSHTNTNKLPKHIVRIRIRIFNNYVVIMLWGIPHSKVI